MPKKKPRKRAIRNKLRNSIAKDLRTPKYRKRVVPDKRTKAQDKALRALVSDEDIEEADGMKKKQEATLYGIACTIEFLYDQLKERGYTRTMKQVEGVQQMFNTEMQLMSLARRSKDDRQE